MFLMTLRRLEVRLLINTRQRGAKGGRGGGWGRGKEVEEERGKQKKEEDVEGGKAQK